VSELSFCVHRLRSDDLEAARRLLTLFGKAFDEPETYRIAPPSDEYLRRLLSNDANIVLAASAKDQVIGGLVAYDLPKLEQARSEIYLYELAVGADHRRQGVATALIRTLQTIARDRGAWVIFVQADYADPPAIALYEKLGAREDVIHCDLPVAGD
jgi:aminoglycoside 3-N-acetyltransferase I